ncbi:dUTP diphosphatase [Macrococcus animalis]|uniref:dUTP diphosphatase n=1 Tax=Macrococcus animalis TaxID=3395467 RepID=UPI0039BE0ED1
MIKKENEVIKMTNELFNKVSEKQEVLDNAVREKKNIDADQWLEDLQISHLLGLRGEVAEFINEARDLWKYWKDKEPELDKLIDEAVDVIHFIHLILNKNEVDNTMYVTTINQRIEHYRNMTVRGVNEMTFQPVPRDYRKYLNDMYNVESIEGLINCYAILLVVLAHYNFKLEDIENAYDKKNDENHKRQESGTY